MERPSKATLFSESVKFLCVLTQTDPNIDALIILVSLTKPNNAAAAAAAVLTAPVVPDRTRFRTWAPHTNHTNFLECADNTNVDCHF